MLGISSENWLNLGESSIKKACFLSKMCVSETNSFLPMVGVRFPPTPTKIENDPKGSFFILLKREWVDAPEYQRHSKCRLKTTVFVGDSQQDMHGEYENTQLKKS